MSIPVPALIDEALFEAVQAQLQENQQRARVGQRGARYLLQGLLVCACCGYAFYGKVRLVSPKRPFDLGWTGSRSTRVQLICWCEVQVLT
jgi:hypothetical protein